MINRCQGYDTFVAEIGNSLFSKDVYSPSIFLGPHLHALPSQVLRFALAFGSLVILSTRLTNRI